MEFRSTDSTRAKFDDNWDWPPLNQLRPRGTIDMNRGWRGPVHVIRAVKSNRHELRGRLRAIIFS